MPMDPQEIQDAEERVVIGRKVPGGWVEFQWTGDEPEGLSDVEVAENLGAMWEGDELVVYNIGAFRHAFAHSPDGYQYDSD